MKYLLDTHALVWFPQDAADLPDAAAGLMEADDAENYVGIASAWEMAVKISLGKWMFRVRRSAVSLRDFVNSTG